jgi:predicted transcriptional regulator
MSQTLTGNIRSEAFRLVEGLPDEATWDDLMYRIYVRQCIDAGIKDADEGKVVDVDEVRRRSSP